MKKTILTVVAAMTCSVGTSSAVTARITSWQYGKLMGENIKQSIQAVNNVKNQIEQIKQFGEQIDLADITNNILGEYGDLGLDGVGSTIKSYEDLVKVDDLSSILDEIQVADVFSNTQGGAFSTVKAPKKVDQDRYKTHAAVESAYEKAIQTQKRVKESNVALAAEAKSQREAAAKAPNQATYTQHINNAKAAEAAIDRNNQEARAAIQNVKTVKDAAEMHEAKAEKAAIDRALEQEEEEMLAAEKQFEENIQKIR